MANPDDYQVGGQVYNRHGDPCWEKPKIKDNQAYYIVPDDSVDFINQMTEIWPDLLSMQGSFYIDEHFGDSNFIRTAKELEELRRAEEIEKNRQKHLTGMITDFTVGEREPVGVELRESNFSAIFDDEEFTESPRNGTND